ncbi:MAG: aldo/keto reductase [Candidatus Bipolaricaulis sp.]|nr:aldo/keto reductase [Candidatus Bipolaricaulis sp.]
MHPVERIDLAPGYSISRVVKGSWQLAGGHGNVDVAGAVADMRRFVDAGITTFDCADIYTGVEEMIGVFLRVSRDAVRSGGIPPIQVHTKCVPDLDRLPTLSRFDVEATVDRSLRRLGVERLDLVQLHWWDYSIPGYVDAAGWLYDLAKRGKVRHLGVTNFDAEHLLEILDEGIPIVSNQVQYSLLDRRPESEMASFCRTHGISLLCYGTVAGGLLSDRYVGAVEPSPPYENRSLTKYKLIVDEFGDWRLFQSLLEVARAIADRHGVSVSTVASRYVLEKPAVAAVIVGARNDRHVADTAGLCSFQLDAADYAALDDVLCRARGPKGAVYGLERIRDGAHGAIMRYNLQAEAPT